MRTASLFRIGMWGRNSVINRCCSTHIHGHSFDHASINSIELLYLLRHLASLVIYLVDGAYLLTNSFQLHFIHLGYYGQRPVEVFHLLAVSSQTLTLVIHLIQHVR